MRILDTMSLVTRVIGVSLTVAVLSAVAGTAERDGTAVPDPSPRPSSASPVVLARTDGRDDRTVVLRGRGHRITRFGHRTISRLLDGHDRRRGPTAIVLPTPSGRPAGFLIERTDVLAPELAARFPSIVTYAGHGTGRRRADVRLTVTPAGLSAQVISPRGNWFVDPVRRSGGRAHVSYRARDVVDRHGGAEVAVLDPLGIGGSAPVPPAAARSTRSTVLPVVQRTYRLAVAVTGEYARFHAVNPAVDDKTEVLAAVTSAVNRVTGIYETDLGVRLQLVATNDRLLYLDPATDPFSNDDPLGLLRQTQTTIDTLVGNANYDVGHVFSTGAGGLAGLGVVGITGYKAYGATGTSTPIGDPYWVDYVAHELGHQFGAEHTFTGVAGACAGNAAPGVAVEPGSGTTIMGYAGICQTDDLANNSDAYFNTVSISQIQANVDDPGQGGAATSSTNRPPTVSVVGGATALVPPRTPFTLTATATDPDGDALTYNWEQVDGGTVRSIASTPTGGALMRSRPPSADPTRTFPALDAIRTNNTNAEASCTTVACLAEYLPTTPRTMTFRVTARDGRRPAGGVGIASVVVTVSGSTPFLVTAPDTAVTLATGATLDVTWSNAGTSAAFPLVDVLLSADGGVTFPTVLASGVPNDGSQSVTLPATVVRQARIMVRPRDAVFFDMSDRDIAIATRPGAPSGARAVAKSASALVSWSAPASDGGSRIVRYTVTSSPGGRSCTATSTSCTVTGLTAGTTYTFTVTAANGLGAGPASTATGAVVPFTKPGAPRNVVAAAGRSSATVSWAAPSSTGFSPVTGYTVTAYPSKRTCRTTGALRCTVTGLTRGTLAWFAVTATNAAGTGPASAQTRPLTVR